MALKNEGKSWSEARSEDKKTKQELKSFSYLKICDNE